MSLINQMLRDLDARRGTAAAPEELLQGVQPGTAAPSRRRGGLIALLVLVLAVAVAVAGWWLFRAGPGPVAGSGASTAVSAAAEAEKPSAPAAPRLQTALVEITPRGGHLRLYFDRLPESVVLVADEQGQRLELGITAIKASAIPAGGHAFPGLGARASNGQASLSWQPAEGWRYALHRDPAGNALVVDALAPPARRSSVAATPGKDARPERKPPKTPPAKEHRRPEVPADSATTSGAGRIEVRRAPPTPAERAAALRRQARQALAEGRAQRAEQLLREALALQPSEAATAEALATLLIRDGRKSEALSLLRGALAQTEDARLRELAARLLVEQQRPQEALALLPAEQVRGHPDLLGLKAALLQSLGRQREARDLYVQALALRPDHAPWWLGLGLALEAEGDGARALAAYRRALAGQGLDSAARDYVEQRIRSLEAAHE
ncbi:MAG: hypothetical protein D6717_11910 [Gammaproteobacteria bacterium]|nr:MAG: hypothetical protein D6717_11910 [Gammaproteobacteria bacterium]